MERPSTIRYLLRTLFLGLLLGILMYAIHLLIAVIQTN